MKFDCERKCESGDTFLLCSLLLSFGGGEGDLFSFYETNLIDSKRVSVYVYALPLRYLFYCYTQTIQPKMIYKFYS